MQAKNLFVFLMAVALVLPLATAFNCTSLNGEENKICRHIESSSWPQSQKDKVIQDLINSDSSLNGNFNSIIDKPTKDVIQLNSVEDTRVDISENNKKFIIDFSSFSIVFYVIYSFLKNYYFMYKLI